MRRGLFWALAATVLASVAALGTSGSSRLVSAVETVMRQRPEALGNLTGSNVAHTATVTALPADIPVLMLEPAKRDVFVPYQAPSASAIAPSAPAPPAPPPPPSMAAERPASPQAPALNVRYLGAVVTPEGKRLVYLARGDSTLTVIPGQRFDDGYVVESITAEAVTLLYPPLGVRVVVPIPAPPTP